MVAYFMFNQSRLRAVLFRLKDVEYSISCELYMYISCEELTFLTIEQNIIPSFHANFYLST